VCEEENEDHHDLLLFGDGTGNQHYCRIASLSRLVRSQITLHTSCAAICKRCYKSYLAGIGVTSAEQRLADHLLLCNKNKPLRPKMTPPNTFMKFENYKRTQKYPFAIYADFEALLVKQNNSNNTRNTSIIHNHDLTSYCYYIKPSENITIELLEKFNISIKPVLQGNIYH